MEHYRRGYFANRFHSGAASFSLECRGCTQAATFRLRHIRWNRWAFPGLRSAGIAIQNTLSGRARTCVELEVRACELSLYSGCQVSHVLALCVPWVRLNKVNSTLRSFIQGRAAWAKQTLLLASIIWKWWNALLWYCMPAVCNHAITPVSLGSP